jgi:UDP-N-acetylglucosamine 1-carboxyvinyltransferase
MHIPYLKEMGANIEVEGNKEIVSGPTKLKGCEVVATDLRAGAAMILAGLIADGITKINSIEHVLRGYENIVEKLNGVGAKIKIVEI